MCGRYTITVTIEELMLRFLIGQPSVPYHRPRYNVAPGQMVLAVIHDGQQNRLGELKWGLIPKWAKDEQIGYKMINARAETLDEKPAYKEPLLRRRCLIPADGFYEWKQTDGGRRPMRITMKDRGLFAMAGLYDIWAAPDGRKVASCTIITTEPNKLMADIHNRMPAILQPEDEAAWLNRELTDAAALKTLLRPYPDDAMEAYPVPPLVGNARNDSPECIRLWEEA